MTTTLPAIASLDMLVDTIRGVPRAYRAADLGPNQIQWCRRRGWIDRRTVVCMERAAAAYERAQGDVPARLKEITV